MTSGARAASTGEIGAASPPTGAGAVGASTRASRTRSGAVAPTASKAGSGSGSGSGSAAASTMASTASTAGAASATGSTAVFMAAPNIASRFSGRAQRVIHHQAAPLIAAPANRPQSGEARPTGTRSRTSGLAKVSAPV